MLKKLFSGSGPQPLGTDEELNQEHHQRAREYPVAGVQPYRESGTLEYDPYNHGGFVNYLNSVGVGWS